MATRRPPSDPPVRTKRIRRSTAACVSCHRSKHRCDGPPGPCHRCETSGIDCVFPPSAGPAASRASSSTSVPRQHTQVLPPVLGDPAPSPNAALPASPLPAKAITFDPTQSVEIVAQLERANARLEALQATLDAVLARQSLDSPRTTGQEASQQGSDASVAARGSLVSNEASAADEHSAMSALMLAEASAASVLASASMATAAQRQQQGALPSAQELSKPDWSIVMPDVLARGIMTVEECEDEFDCFFTNIQPWAALLSLALDRQALAVRARSPLLFHAILLVSLYYRPRTRANLARYCAVSSLVDALLSPQILCPTASDLSHDFVRAVHLLMMYKPVAYARLEACGVTDASAVESASKMNVCASWMLRLLVSRVSTFIGLPAIADTFAQAFAKQQFAPIPDTLISQQRLYLDCVFRELTGALQSGKSANFTPQAACRTTRLFAHLARQPSDVRLAASVELVAHAAEAFALLGVPSSATLRQFDDALAAWTEYWRPRLTPHAAPDDAVRWSVFYPYAGFTRLVVRGFVLPAWRAKREAAAASGAGAGMPVLSGEEQEHIVEAVAIAEEMLMAMTVEGRSLREGVPGARVLWGSAPLVPDPSVVKLLKWATDSLTCVMFSYPLISLSKLAEEGLVHGDLSVLAPNTPPQAPKPMTPDDKLCRLLKLGADLLEAIAPSPVHPSRGQAAYLRKVREARISLSSGEATPVPPGKATSASTSAQPFLSSTRDPAAPSATAFLSYAPSAAAESLATAYQPTPLNSPPFPASTPIAGVGMPLNLDALPGLLAADGWSVAAGGTGMFDDPLVGWML